MGSLRVEPINTDQLHRTISQTSLDNVATEHTHDEQPLVTVRPNPQTVRNERA